MPKKASTSRARKLRRDMTIAERKLWYMVRNRQIEGAYFRRQVPIGSFIVDFACLKEKLIVEVDGGQHYLAKHMRRDEQRTAQLHEKGFRVLRVSNKDVLENPEGVYITIQNALAAATPEPPT